MRMLVSQVLIFSYTIFLVRVTSIVNTVAAKYQIVCEFPIGQAAQIA